MTVLCQNSEGEKLLSQSVEKKCRMTEGSFSSTSLQIDYIFEAAHSDL